MPLASSATLTTPLSRLIEASPLVTLPQQNHSLSNDLLAMDFLSSIALNMSAASFSSTTPTSSATSSSREPTLAIDSPSSEIPQKSSPIQNIPFQMESARLGALSQTPKDVVEQLSALAQKLKSLLSTSSTTATISLSKELTSDPNSPTPEIPHYDNSAQYVSFRENIDELEAILQALKGRSFQVLEDNIKLTLTSIQYIRSETELMRTFLEMLKSRKESPPGVIRALEDVTVSESSFIKVLEDGVELQLAWVQTYKDAAINSSLLMIPTSEGTVMQTAPTHLVENMMDLSSLPSIQELNNSIKPLQTSVQAPRDSTKPTEISAQAFEALIVESRDLVQYLKNATVIQVALNQVLKFEMDTQLLSDRCFQYAQTTELGSIQVLKGVTERLLRRIQQTLLDTAKM